MIFVASTTHSPDTAPSDLRSFLSSQSFFKKFRNTSPLIEMEFIKYHKLAKCLY